MPIPMYIIVCETTQYWKFALRQFSHAKAANLAKSTAIQNAFKSDAVLHASMTGGFDYTWRLWTASTVRGSGSVLFFLSNAYLEPV